MAVSPLRLAAVSPVAPDPFLSAVPPCAFGKKQWETYFGDVGVEPPLPSNIEDILLGDSARVDQMLVLIPQTVNGVPYTLNLLQTLIRAPQRGGKPAQINVHEGYGRILAEQGPKPAPASHWVLMTRETLPGSTYKSFKHQCQFVEEELGCFYRVPPLLDAVTCVLLEEVRTGIPLYTDTWARVREQPELGDPLTKGWRFAFRNFEETGLCISCYDDVADEETGVGAFRMLSDR